MAENSEYLQDFHVNKNFDNKIRSMRSQVVNSHFRVITKYGAESIVEIYCAVSACSVSLEVFLLNIGKCIKIKSNKMALPKDGQTYPLNPYFQSLYLWCGEKFRGTKQLFHRADW